jgi:hypothetical protein
MSKIIILTGFSQSSNNNKTASAFKIIRGTRKYEYMQVFEGLIEPQTIELRTILMALTFLMRETDTVIEKKILVVSEDIDVVKILRKTSKLLKKKGIYEEIDFLKNKEHLLIIKDIFAMELSPGQFKFKYISIESEEKPNEDVAFLASQGANEKINSYVEIKLERKRCTKPKRFKRKRRRKKGQTGKSTPHGVRR